MSKKIVIALGGNALGKNLEEQRLAVKKTAKVICDLIADGNDLVITHGNGPQVGMIQSAMEEHKKNDPQASEAELSVSVAMSQAYIASDLECAIIEELSKRAIQKTVSSILTHVVVDKNDEAFKNPSKPIGSFLTKEEAEQLRARGISVIEDSGRGYRQVVASPKPSEIIEKNVIQSLFLAGQVVIACGGGGIPLIRDGNKLIGVPAVIDKDLASAKLASDLKADYFIILTAVEKVAINFNKENQKWLSKISLDEAKNLIKEGQFAKGSMLPKIEAAIQFIESNENASALITLLEKASEGIAGKTGTLITR